MRRSPRPATWRTAKIISAAGLLRFDMSEKPAYKRLYHLIKEVWTTDETPEVGKNGEVKFRGFLGEYEVTAGGKTYAVTLNENGKTEVLK